MTLHFLQHLFSLDAQTRIYYPFSTTFIIRASVYLKRTKPSTNLTLQRKAVANFPPLIYIIGRKKLTDTAIKLFSCFNEIMSFTLIIEKNNVVTSGSIQGIVDNLMGAFFAAHRDGDVANSPTRDVMLDFAILSLGIHSSEAYLLMAVSLIPTERLLFLFCPYDISSKKYLEISRAHTVS